MADTITNLNCFIGAMKHGTTMTITEFLKAVREIKEAKSLDYTDPTYFIFIHNGLKTATVNQTGFHSMAGIAYVIVVTAYRWTNFGYVNTSLTTLMMVDNQFNPVDKIPFGSWDFELSFSRHPGSYYDAWCPYPIMTLASDSRINTNQSKCPYHWDWPQPCITDFNTVLKSVNEFVAAYDSGKLGTPRYSENDG